MKTPARPAVVAAALALAAALVGCDDGGRAEIGPPAIAEVVPPVDEASREPKSNLLEVPRGPGQPVVQVKGGRKVELFNEPGGKSFLRVKDETEFGSPSVFAVARTRGDWAGLRTPYRENGNLSWVELDSRRLKAKTVTWSMVIDLSDYRADLVVKGRKVRSFGVSIGAPGSETPLGEYAVTDTFRGDLNPAYGCCAVALTARQLKLPSGWLGGDRIAIHGTAGPIGSALSNGCVRARDADVSELVDRLPLGTPVTIRQ